MKVLVGGGAGYIGSTICSALLDAGIAPVILDNLSTGPRAFTDGRIFYEGDIADSDLLDRIFVEHPDIGVAIHCSALIVVPESVSDPLRYYRENVGKSIEFYASLQRNGCRRMIFSSSAALYAAAADFTVEENSAIAPQSPYARTKAVMETALRDFAAAGGPHVISLRYFNPIGADPSLRTGLQLPRPTHALGKLIEAFETGDAFRLTGVDWATRDGSGVRDYVHVWDLALAHVAAVEKFDEVTAVDSSDYEVINLGTGSGTTVRELIAAFERVVGRSLPVEETGPRPGDVVGAYTRCDKSLRLLGWKAERSIDDGIRDALDWAKIRAERLGEV